MRIAEPHFMGREVEYVTDALQRKSLSMGEYVRRFEQLVAASMNARFAVAVTSGTAALHVALLALGVKPGDRVVVPACSYIAVANAVHYCGGVPIFVDVDPDTWTLDPKKAAAAVEEHLAVGVITVDLYGARCARPHVTTGTWILQDACEAHGLHIDGDMAVLSFYGNKIATTGEGGAVVTNSAPLANVAALLRGQGTTGAKRYVHELLGYNYRLTDLQAALGCAQMEKLGVMLTRRAALRRCYEQSLPREIIRQRRSLVSVDWVMPVLVDDRDEVALKLEQLDIETRPVFPPLHKQPQYESKWTHTLLPVAELLAKQGLLLPLHLGMRNEDVFRVCDALVGVLG